jgi:hypothetical protein
MICQSNLNYITLGSEAYLARLLSRSSGITRQFRPATSDLGTGRTQGFGELPDQSRAAGATTRQPSYGEPI